MAVATWNSGTGRWTANLGTFTVDTTLLIVVDVYSHDTWYNRLEQLVGRTMSIVYTVGSNPSVNVVYTATAYDIAALGTIGIRLSKTESFTPAAVGNYTGVFYFRDESTMLLHAVEVSFVVNAVVVSETDPAVSETTSARIIALAPYERPEVTNLLWENSAGQLIVRQGPS
jgi:hypothetical protein